RRAPRRRRFPPRAPAASPPLPLHDALPILVDEVHAFAGDDRGWHLLAVLERLTRVAGRPIQRVGLSATVGNPEELLTWLQGSGTDRKSTRLNSSHVKGSYAVFCSRKKSDRA